MASTLKDGDRIRLKAPTAFGFKGVAIVVGNHAGRGPDDLITWRPVASVDPHQVGIALRSQVAKCRSQQHLHQQTEELYR